MSKKALFILFLAGLLLQSNNLFAQNSYPHILVKNTDRDSILQKVENYSWARAIYNEMEQRVDCYANRHTEDPNWLLSRYLMNRTPGKCYTHAYSDEQGHRIVNLSGDAPVPTVRVSTQLRAPITPEGSRYRKPSIEELIPNDTAKLMLLYNPDTHQQEWVDPQAYITDINGELNDLALESAILYWLTQKEKYARLAADLLNQWGQGVKYQQPIIGPCRTGLLDIQTLGDQSYRSIILAYDFVKPWMQQNGYDLNCYETVFEKFASTLAFRGFWNNNWYAAESSTLVFAALSLENKQNRDYYLQFFLEKDTIKGNCGQLALPSTVEQWLTPNGHWKEPGGYHNYPVSNLLLSALALENNGYAVFKSFPALFQASCAMLKYSFPNLTVSAFGDTGRSSQSPQTLEIGLLNAIRYHDPSISLIAASIKKLIERGMYNRAASGFLGLLCFLPEIPASTATYQWPQSGTLDFASYYFQRNGMDTFSGLMYGVQGASYNHNHCNGMAMELYGCGEVMGIDAGTGPNYEHPLHTKYFSQWAAHNTVVAAGASSSVPFAGGAGRKEIGAIQLAAIEPKVNQLPVSSNYSFTDTRYFDKSTGTNQWRTLAIVRTSPSNGYYIDIFRSDNKISNDYVYHNIGETVKLLDQNRIPLPTTESKYPLTGSDHPGFRFFTNIQKLSNYESSVIALFPVRKDSTYNYMQIHLVGNKNRDYYTAYSPKTQTAGKTYNGKPIPLFTIRTTNEAKTKPFIALFEPFSTENNYSVERIETHIHNSNPHFTSLKVEETNGTSRIILQSIEPDSLCRSKDAFFKGYFGIITVKNDLVNEIYLGSGKTIGMKGIRVESDSANGSAALSIDKNTLIINCNQPIVLTFEKSNYNTAELRTNNSAIPLEVIRINRELKIKIPAIRTGTVILSNK